MIDDNKIIRRAFFERWIFVKFLCARPGTCDSSTNQDSSIERQATYAFNEYYSEKTYLSQNCPAATYSRVHKKHNNLKKRYTRLGLDLTVFPIDSTPNRYNRRYSLSFGDYWLDLFSTD